jgi:IS5 family transposase
MLSLLLLKRLYNLDDETVVEQWVKNPYMQHFSGETEFHWELPCEPSDLVHFRKRIGQEGVKKILKLSIDLHGKDAQEAEKKHHLSNGCEASSKDCRLVC